MFEKKNFIVNCDVCDARKIQEESLSGYEQIILNTDFLLVDERAMLVRCEYDGAEWWRPIPAPAPQGDAFDCVKIDSSMSSRCLSGLNEPCEEQFQFGMVGVWLTSIGNT